MPARDDADPTGNVAASRNGRRRVGDRRGCVDSGCSIEPRGSGKDDAGEGHVALDIVHCAVGEDVRVGKGGTKNCNGSW